MIGTFNGKNQKLKKPMLKVTKPITWDNVEYTGYEVYGIEWVLAKDEFYVVVVYLNNKRRFNKVVKHKFDVGNNVDIDNMINKVHSLHDGKNI